MPHWLEGWRGAEGEAAAVTMTVLLSQHSLGPLVLARCAIADQSLCGEGKKSVAR